MKYINWYEEERELETTDGKKIQVLHLNYIDEEDALNEWAEHFRKNYRKNKVVQVAEYIKSEVIKKSNNVIRYMFG